MWRNQIGRFVIAVIVALFVLGGAVGGQVKRASLECVSLADYGNRLLLAQGDLLSVEPGTFRVGDLYLVVADPGHPLTRMLRDFRANLSVNPIAVSMEMDEYETERPSGAFVVYGKLIFDRDIPELEIIPQTNDKFQTVILGLITQNVCVQPRLNLYDQQRVRLILQVQNGT